LTDLKVTNCESHDIAAANADELVWPLRACVRACVRECERASERASVRECVRISHLFRALGSHCSSSSSSFIYRIVASAISRTARRRAGSVHNCVESWKVPVGSRHVMWSLGSLCLLLPRSLCWTRESDFQSQSHDSSESQSHNSSACR
jgi:hypothetical protein